MVNIKKVSAKSILDTRGDKTIKINIITNVGSFSASSPTGKSTGKFEAKTYKKSLDEDILVIKKFSDYFSNDFIEKFEDLKRIEDIVEGHVGANTLFAIESATLKALAFEKQKHIWELINPGFEKTKFPRLVANCIGGGKHTQLEKKPNIQEFLLIPNKKTIKQSFELNKKTQKQIGDILKRQDKKFNNKKNDENAWATTLTDKETLDVLSKPSFSGDIGVDVAASSFFKRKKYNYINPLFKRTPDEHFNYISNLVNNFNLYYIEDPFEENDFESHAKLLKKYPYSLVVGDDLTVTNSKRLKKAIEKKSISGIIVKPNQCGSLLEVSRVCELAKKNNIKIIFSHRSGETEENILADLAFGFQADFLKTGLQGKGRNSKIKRLIEIQKSI
ncbi:MAG: enolase C-terminal domain-like protein [Nanoarchaeota archaeon]